ncbi:MAG: hypothetical protein AMJ54_00320 [Deltaproteobacteria bacterium SG8_13]|nr:MAG: hypothetical protein AMJ54_00320 [Deltaproteobacteria bacterium SG8_13]
MEPIISTALVTQLLTWRAVIDILLVAAGLYVLYRTLLGLGTWKMVTGIFIAIVFFLVANLLDLRGIEWVFSNISQVAVIAIIIIFQPEIRKLLERTASIRRARIGKYSEEFVQMLSEAILAMARKRQGAIVVLPGKDPIEEWLSGGYPLDAKVSIPLILSIFDPNSPGHDGAMIAEKGRFTRFGVRLPLSQRSTLTDDYGTRHHAAMGLAERSDAMAIVVSEERGTVSVFLNGQMQPVAGGEDLLRLISAHWKDTASSPIEWQKGRPRWPVFSQILASLVVAVLFYSSLIIAQGEVLEKVVTVPVEYTASPAHLVLAGDKAKEVRLHLSGPKSDLDSVNPDQVNVKIDLSKAVAGKQAFLITQDNIKLPRHVLLLDVVPHSIELELTEILEHEIPIKPQLVGKLPAGLKIASIEVTPAMLKVLSPVTQQKEVAASIITTPIYLESITDDTQIYCKIIAPPSIQPVDKRWPDVQVTIRIKRR